MGLLLAFVPSALMIGFFSFANNSNPPVLLFILLCLASLACCITSASLIFRRNTGLAIFVGILFLLLNSVISFFFGCGAILTAKMF